MDDGKFRKITDETRSQLRALMVLPSQMLGGQAIWYNAYLDDTEVVVLGFLKGDPDGQNTVAPVAIAVTEEVFHRLRTDEEGSRTVAGVDRPVKVKERAGD